MPRRKSAAATATPASRTSHKRNLSEAPASATPGSRSSKRLKETAEKEQKTKSTPTKSKYFEDPESDDEEREDSGYEDEGASATDAIPSEDSESEQDDDSEEDRKTRKKGKKRASAKKPAGESSTASGKELWRPGVKTGLGPGKQVFIEKPKPRGDGGIKYVPARIHPNTMAFLADLKKNNDREWLKMHDPDYRQSWKDWESFVETLTEKISEVDETIPELPPKDLVFRIYRDIRFSSDPTPYKPHFSAAWSRTGRKGPYACYYVHIEPGEKSFVGSGLWHPEAQPVALLRRNIDRKPHKIQQVLTAPEMRKQILGGIPNDERKAVKAFALKNAENALKTKPKGYEADHPNIELLRLRNFTIGKSIPDEVILSAKGLDAILELIGVMAPFVTYLNSVVMPDEDGSSEEESNDSGDEE